MKASDLWHDEEYAYQKDRKNNVETPTFNVQRVRVISTQRRRDWGNDRLTTYAEVEFLDKETGAGTGVNRTVRARDIVDFWDDYSDRLQDIVRRREAAEAEKERIKREKEMEHNAARVRFGIKTGLPSSLIEVDDYEFTINRRKYTEWVRQEAVVNGTAN